MQELDYTLELFLHTLPERLEYLQDQLIILSAVSFAGCKRVQRFGHNIKVHSDLDGKSTFDQLSSDVNLDKVFIKRPYLH